MSKQISVLLSSVCLSFFLVVSTHSLFGYEDLQTEYQADHRGFRSIVLPFLKKHCFKCHGLKKQEGEFRIDKQLPNDFLNRTVTEKWSEVLNVLNSGSMPPKNTQKPNPKEMTKVIEWITRERIRGEQGRLDGKTIFRRMNREEYNNTIRDLVGINLDLVDDFPEDPSAGGFDNNGSALTISPLHLELYLKVAQKILDRAIVTTKRQPTSIKWHFEIDEDKLGSDHNRVHVDANNTRVLMSKYSNQVRDGMVVMRMPGRMCQIAHFHVPHAGNYIIRIRAAGVTPSEKIIREGGPKINLRRQVERESKISNPAKRQESRERYNKWSRPSVQRHYSTDRSYQYGPPRLKVKSRLGSLHRIDTEMDIDAQVSAPKVYELQSWFTPENAGIQLTNEYHVPYNHINEFAQRHEDFPRPELLVDWVEIEGPIYDEWPPRSHKRILINSPNKRRNEVAYARDVLANFMRRAYRRPLQDGELEPYVALFQRVQGNKSSFEEAIKVPLTAVLVSPDFLYLVEEKDAHNASERDRNARPLNHYELATRLSYFLWSSMPDDELLELADAGKLDDLPTLHAQVEHMLANKKSAALVKNFTGQWLDLREVGTNPPVVSIYPRYDNHLEVSMRGESEAFFAHILHNDISVLDFLSCNYITINERLARFYDIPGISGDHFRIVKIPQNRQRGGLVTQASILSVTSNGTRTSPVWRGVWILENLLGDPPPPPPPNAGDIPAGVPGLDKVTVRQRLNLHRKQSQCARCHNKIDPLGFSLENFAASGEWRTRELKIYMDQATQNNGPLIDTKSQLPDGTEFEGVEGLKRELLNRKDQFQRCLTEKLYTYALGRELSYSDQPVIDDAVKSMTTNDQTLRSLILHIVSSKLFRTKR